jgi:hypothetical protein
LNVDLEKSLTPQADIPDRLSFEVPVTTDAKLPTRLQLAEELEVGAVHVVTRGSAGQLSFGVGIFYPHGMGSVAQHEVVTPGANIYGIRFEQGLSSRPVILVTVQTSSVHAVFVSFGPVFLQLMTSVTQGLINSLFSIITPGMTKRTLCILCMWIGGTLSSPAQRSIQRIVLSKDEAP